MLLQHWLTAAETALGWKVVQMVHVPFNGMVSSVLKTFSGCGHVIIATACVCDAGRPVEQRA